MNQLLIGLWGPAGVGKDTVADALGFPKASFAATLKSYLAPIFKELGVDISDREQKEKVRDLMICLGKTARSLDENFWVRKLKVPNDPVVVITDVRYWNEILAITLRGGVVFELYRPNIAPANAEEERSFNEIRSMCNRLNVSIPLVVNGGTPKETADKVISMITKRFQSAPVRTC